MHSKRVVFLVCVLMIAVNFAVVQMEKQETIENAVIYREKVSKSSRDYPSREPIRIDNDAGFIYENGVSGGSGTSDDPYIIENYSIDGKDYGCCIYIGNTTRYFVIRNCTLYNASGNSEPYFLNSGILLYNVTNGRVENVNFTGCGTGFSIYVSSYIEIVNCNSSVNGLAASIYQSNNCTLADISAYYNFLGIWVYQSQRIEGINLTLEENSDGSNPGLEIRESSNVTIANSTIRKNVGGITMDTSEFIEIIGCNISENSDPGIYIKDSKEIDIALCQIIENENYGIYIYNLDSTALRNIYISNNNLYNNTSANIFIQSSSGISIDRNIIEKSKFGIYLSKFSGGRLSNNTVKNSRSDNIYLTNSCNFNLIYGNEITGSNTGINITSNCLNNFLIKNKIQYCEDAGINLLSSQYTNISENIVQKCSLGISILSSSYSTISNNTIIWNTNFGMLFGNSDYNTISYNAIVSNRGTGGSYGIYLTSTSKGNVFYGNAFIRNTRAVYDTQTANNLWYSTVTNRGNYWDNWTMPDADNNGIVDIPYPINPGVNDTYPLTQIPRAPIRINNDDEFTPANGVYQGLGTPEEPYVLENFNIDGTNFGYCIYIGNTTKYFTIRNCTLHNASNPMGNVDEYYMDAGVNIYNATNGKLFNCSMKSCVFGAYIQHSEKIDISNCSAFDNTNNIQILNSKSISVTNCKLTSALNSGLVVQESAYYSIENNSISNCFYGINAKNTYYGNISMNLISKHSYAIQFINSSLCNIKNNNITNAIIGLELNASSNNNTVFQNKINNTQQKGIYIYDASNDNFIAENNVSENSRAGLYLERSENNTIFNNTILGNGGNGIFVSLSSKNNITSNIIKSNSKNGIHFENSESNNVEWNDIEYNDNLANGGGVYGLNLNQSLIHNNSIISNGKGIYLASSYNNSIQFNQVARNGNGGIYLSYSQENKIISNDITNNMGFNMIVETSQNTSIFDNTITASSIQSGIKVYASESCKLVNNTVISSNNYDYAIEVTENSNFTEVILNNIIEYNTGIYIQNAHHLIIASNNISRCMYGIYSNSSKNDTIYANTMHSNDYGIKVYNNLNLKIHNNEIYQSNGGIEISSSEQCIIQSNYIHDCIYSISFWMSKNNIIVNNDIYNSTNGIHLEDSDNNSILYNYLVNITDKSNNSIFLEGTSNHTYVAFNYIQNFTLALYILSSNNTICNNILVSNNYGLYLKNSDDNIISFNRIESNSYYGLYLTTSSGNIIHHNSFISNGGLASQAFDDNYNLWDLDSKGNYWHNWTSPDFNNDGVVDIAYNIDGGSNQDHYPLTYSPSLGIRINNDSEFTPANGVVSGSGTFSDPYIIDGWSIDGTPFGYCIYIGNTTKYFVIRNCTLMNVINGDAISFVNVTHGLVDNCTIFNCKYAINISFDSSHIALINNTIYSCEYGVFSFNYQSPSPIPSLNSIIISKNYINCSVYCINLPRLKDGIISNNTFETTETSGVGLRLVGGSNNLIISNNFNSTFDFAIRLISTNLISIENNTLSSNINAGIYLSNSENITMASNIITNTKCGIEIKGSSIITIFDTNISNSNIGIDISPFNFRDTININITHCTIHHTSTAINITSSSDIHAKNNNIFSSKIGIRIWSSSGIIIDSNDINCTYNCINAIVWANYCTISNNTLSIYNATEPPAAISLFTSSHNIIFNNTFTISAGWAIKLAGSSSNTIEKNNASYSPNGISLNANSDNNILSFNTLQSYETYGVYIFNSTWNTIDNNTIISKVGIYIDNANNNTISSNDITNIPSNPRYGIEIRNSTYHIIYNNNISNTGLGILINQSSYIIVLECNIWNNLEGINATNSYYCSFINNTIANSQVGIIFQECSNNLIHHNTFSNNNLHAYDAGTNSWNNSDGGNSWDNWTIPDRIAPFGIVDSPFYIDGGAIDYLPLTTYIGNPIAEILSITPSTATYPENITFQGYGYCDGLEIVSYNWSSNETGFLSDQANCNITLYGGTYSISFSVRASDGRWSECVYVTITVNQAKPTAYIECSSTSAEFGTTIYFNGSASDIDGYIVEYNWSSDIDGFLSSQASFSISNLSIGMHNILFCVMDNNGSWSVPVSVNVVIRPIGILPPVAKITYVFPTVITEGETVYFVGEGQDPAGGNIVAYSWSSNLDGLLSTNASFNTSSLSLGTHNITFRVQNNNGVWSEPANVTVIVNQYTGNNAKPTAKIISITPNPAIFGDVVIFNGTGSDSDGYIIGYRWVSNITGEINSIAVFSISTLPIGTHTILFFVLDNNNTWSEPAEMLLIINPNIIQNKPPIANIISIPQEAYTGELVTLVGSGTDEDGYIVAFNWTSSILGYLGSNSTLNLTNLTLGTHTISLSVLDNNGTWSNIVSATIVIKSHEVTNSPPTASILTAPTKAKAGSTITLKGSGLDNDGTIIAYNWSSNRQGFLGNKAEIKISNLTVGEHIIQFTVCDDKGAWSSPASITITIEKRESTAQDNNLLLIFIAILVIIAIIIIILLILRKKKTPVQPVVINTDTDGTIPEAQTQQGQTQPSQPSQTTPTNDINDIKEQEKEEEKDNVSQLTPQNNIQTDLQDKKTDLTDIPLTDTKNESISNQDNTQPNQANTTIPSKPSEIPITPTTPPMPISPKLEDKTTESELHETSQIANEDLRIKAHEQMHASAKEMVSNVSKNATESWYASKQQNEVPTAIPIATPVSDGKPRIIASKEENKLEQLFLVYNDGRLIEKWPKDKGAIDGDTVSSMLTAVQEFVKDSFAGKGLGINVIKYGRTLILIERGVQMYLAAVITGEEPPLLRTYMRRALVEVRNRFTWIAKKHWSGDIDEFTGVSDILENEIVNKIIQPDKEKKNEQDKNAQIMEILGRKSPKEDFTPINERIKSCETEIEKLTMKGIIVEGPIGKLKLAKTYTASKNFNKADKYSKEAMEEIEKLKKLL